jgi:phospholipid-binding lipoprotein MlaA
MEAQLPEGIHDPLESMNRVFFEFNDKLYFWFLKPVSRGYEKVVPWEIRTCTQNFFRNLLMPVRAVNCLLQGKMDGLGNELLRFVINTTAGFGGLADPATAINIMPRDEDLGQTLGAAGVGHGIFIMWPVLGPSSIRDTVGMAGDGFLSVLSYYPDEFKYKLGVRGLEKVNDTSFKIGDYESLKDAAFDPYSALRDAYFQIREKKVRE